MTDKPEDASRPEFQIVGIGASAGGLKAAEVFLQNCPADTGMAFVLVFHLDPRHKSLAAELLQRHTAMPVAQVVGHVRLAPDHVYVIPPDRGLSLTDGELLLTQREPEDGRPTVIDHFFRALAAHMGERAVGVVLSGTGSEGSEGLKAIKEAGGLTLVQDEGEAEYSGMPRSAVATGLVDFVLPVAQIPAKILAVREFVVDFALPDGSRQATDDDADILQKIFVQLRTRTGHDFSYYKDSTLRRRITRRMQVHQLSRLADYLALLRDDGAEVQTLFRELLISVTSFFRDPDAMQVLNERAIRQICAEAGEGPVRVWSAGCATGEEAYSLAMLLVEACDALPRPPRLQVFASDVDERALDVARRGAYPEAIAADVSAVRLQRFFNRNDNGDGYIVKSSLRELILFTQHNLLQDPPFSKLDLVSCRNVLIYLRSEMQARVYALFHFALHAQGHLFLGSSESLGESARLFTELDRKAKLYQSRPIPAAEVRLPLMSPLARRNRAPNAALPAARKRLEEITRDALLADYAPPCVIVNDSSDVVYISGRVGKYLEPGSGTANYNVLDMARDGLRLALRSALYRVFQQGESLSTELVRLRGDDGGADTVLRLTVRLLPAAEDHALVAFEPVSEADAAAVPWQAGDRDRDRDGMVGQLERELAQMRESLQITIEELETSNEELRASNEELQSVNEELQSTTEELETGKEELQSTNEELLTVNHELHARNDELARANADLGNLIASIEIGTLFLDERLCVRRYTPQATQCFNLIASDLGRPFTHITHQLEDNTLAADAERVLQSLAPMTRELATSDGHIVEVRLRPYRSNTNRVGGVVLTLIDVTRRHQHERETQALNVELQAQRNYAENIIATMREPLLVLDATLRVVTANRAFYRQFATAPKDTEGRQLYELGAGQWNIAALRRLLETVLREHSTVAAFEVCHDFGRGERVLLLNARMMATREAGKEETLVLLTFDDVTQQRQSVAELAESERKYRNLFKSMDEAFCLYELRRDEAGRPVGVVVIEANPAVERHIGYSGKFDQHGMPEALTADPEWLAIYAEVAATGKAKRFEKHSEHLNRWYDAYVFRERETQPPRVAELFRDITERKLTERRQQMLIHELNHRVRNNLAIVQALAAQSFDNAGCDGAYATFEARLHALATVHGLLAQDRWQGAPVSNIVQRGLAPWAAEDGERVQARGPALHLNAMATVALAMALHELATNAAKYGALSNNSGTVSVRWSVLAGTPQMFRLRWQERGGPPVVEPESRGFGSWLIESGLAQDLGGSVRLVFAKSGLTCTLEAPVGNISDGA